MKLLGKIILGIFGLGILVLPAQAETTTITTTKTTTAMRPNAPMYYGPVQEVDLEELTLADFQSLMGTKPSVAEAEYVKYKNDLNNPSTTTQVLYKMKVVDRDLTTTDFQGPDETLDMAQSRYNEYQRVSPTMVDGKETRYVYVYHAPIVRQSTTTIVNDEGDTTVVNSGGNTTTVQSDY